MSKQDLFLNATKKRLRFTTNRGGLSTEDLWILSLRDLDELAVALDAKLKSQKKSFIEEKTEGAASEQLAFDVVLAIIEHKKEETERAAAKAKHDAERQKLKSLIAAAEVKDLEKMSADDLRKKLAEMDGNAVADEASTGSPDEGAAPAAAEPAAAE